MKYCIQILSIVLLLCTLSCSENNKSSEYALSGIPYEDSDNNTYGIIDYEGNSIVSGLEDATFPVINGYFVKETEDGAQILCKVDGNSYSVIPQTSDYNTFGVFNDGLIPACKEEDHIVILDENGNVVFSLENYDNSEVVGCASYSSNKLRVKLMNGSVIYLDKSGNKLFGKSYEWGTDFVNGKAVVCVSDDEYSLIGKDGNIVFSFKSDDEDHVKISHEYELVSSKEEDDIVRIYDFKGNVACKCPSKVEEIYAFGKECFIFKKDYEYGLMTYDGIELIRAKYDQLVFNGNTLLATYEDRDNEILILDLNGNITGTLDGEKIYSAHEYGFDFPNIIKREDDEVYLVNDRNEVIGSGPLNIDIDLNDLEYIEIVRSQHFPKNEVLNTVMNLCGNGTGLPKDQGAFFLNGSNHCHPSDIKLLKDRPIEQLAYKYSCNTNISEGVNYSIDFEVSFDEPIIREGSSELNPTAWLNGMKITVSNSNRFQNAAFFNLCRQTLEDSFDCEITATDNNDYVLTSKDHENLIILVHGEENCFYIYLRQRNDLTLSYWTNYIRG